MKVYITQPYGGSDEEENIMNILKRSGFRCVDSSCCSSFSEAEQELSSCDAYITYACGSYGDLSDSTDVELEYALAGNKPIIVIREFPDYKRIGNGTYGYSLLSRENAALFDISAGADAEQLPEFIRNHIAKCGKDSGAGSLVEEIRPDKPYEGDKPHIFISYSHKDRTEVFGIIRELQNNGYRVWYDEGIDPASEWDENIAEHISECSYLIAFISPNYIESQNCRDEISYARDLNKDRLLVYLEETDLPAGMAMRLMRLQAIHKYRYRTSPDFYEKLFAAHGIGIARD